VGTTWARWLVHWTIIRTLQVLHGLYHKNKIKQNSGNSRIFPHKFILPFPSSHDLATQAASDLTHALLHPQPAGPFCQVGDDQTIALRRLASIFISAKPRSKNNSLAPQDEIENNARQRVQNTVSPQRVASTDPEQTSLQHVLPSQSTPNSHRRQHTPVRRLFTPPTPHVMVRRSARQKICPKI
jgi:hypothetical protein